MRKFREAIKPLSYWPRTVRLIWEAAPGWTTAWAVLLIIQGALPAVSIYLTKLLVDSLVSAIGSGGAWAEVRPAVVLLVISAGVLLLTEVLHSLSEWVRAAQSEYIQDHVKSLIHRQATSVDVSFYESPDYHDLLERARSDAGSRPLAILEGCGSLAQNGITLIAIALVLVPYSPWLPLALFVSMLPALYVVLRFDRRYHDWWQRTTSDRRRIQYIDLMLTHSHAAPELRLFGWGGHFQSAYAGLRAGMRSERLSQLRKQGVARLGAGVAALLITGATMAWMVWRAFQGLMTMGDLALFYQAFNRGQGLMRALLGSVGQLYSNSMVIGNLYRFLDLKPCLKEPSEPLAPLAFLKKGIEFRSITFGYPGSDRKALRDFSLRIPAGKVVAIVGPNGAGKSTLVKLLCRFYEQESGAIEMDELDIRQFAAADLRRMLTVLFQFPLSFHATAAENIALGDIGAAPAQEELEAAARFAGAHDLINSLPNGYETRLGKWFADGVELSGGEWQRIAMARAYLRRSPVIILDEPTSFMDSWAEAEWFNRFRALVEGRTAIIITHRFTIAMRADIIHVMDKGEIVESGSHTELLALGGLYADSWTVQMQSHLRADSPAGAGEARLEAERELDEIAVS